MLDFHPLANLFPLIEGQAFDDLVADVKANGLLDKIVILDGKIVDGRNRYRAGIAAGIIDADAPAHNGIGMQPWCELYLPAYQGDPLTWVLSKNLHRRHLDESQRSAVGARLETLGPSGKRPDGADANLQRSRAEIGKIVNVSPRSIASSKKVLNEGAPELFEAIERGAVKASVAEKLLVLSKDRQAAAVRDLAPKKLTTLAKQATRQLVEMRLADKQRALPTEQYGVVYADPAWRFQPYSRETGLDRAADNHYPTQTTDEIIKLPVGTLAASDAVLFLWATAPMLCDALRVMRFWGFEYKTHFVWDKLLTGTGYWSRNRHELLLIGTRGGIPAPAPGTQWESIIAAPAGRHSEKPDRAYELIEDYYPNLPRIELNARRRRDGWTAWGLEAPEATGEEIALVGDAGAHEHIELRAFAAHEGAAVAAESAAQVEEAAKDTSSTDRIVREFYAAGGPRLIARLCEATGLNSNQVKGIAKRLQLTSRERQREAVAEANRHRGGQLNDLPAGQGGHRDV